MPKNENIDAFWDIEELLPRTPKKAPARRMEPDTTAAEITLAEAEQTADGGIPIPSKKERPERSEAPKKTVLREYTMKDSFVQSVKVMPWPTVFSFYDKFRKDALRHFEREHEACEYVYFFSYMPQYDQMTVAQMAYYLYWRGEIRRGIYLKTDINYLFLYAYEIINLPEKIPPKKGAVLLSRLWSAYRDDFHYLDKYLGEWLCDYCLVHGVSPDWDVVDVFAGEVAGRVSLPEFYLRDKKLPWGLIASVATYDYQKSKYYEPYRAAFDLHIPRAVERAVNRVMMANPEMYGIVPMKTVRDSFSGAVACHSLKFKLEIERYSVRRGAAVGGYDLKHIFSSLIKLCENQLRAVFGIKSRFSPTGVDTALKEELLAYFDEQYPNRNLKKQKKESDEEEAYMALYEPKQNGPADISEALAIEKEAWETAALLSTDDEELVTETLIPPMDEPRKEAVTQDSPFSFGISEDFPSGDFDFIGNLLSETQREALKAALSGSFEAYSRQIGVMAETLRGEINEIAMEEIGDMLIESDFSVLEDYAEDVEAALGAQ